MFVGRAVFAVVVTVTGSKLQYTQRNTTQYISKQSNIIAGASPTIQASDNGTACQRLRVMLEGLNSRCMP